jgi:signal transduction histidine kinase
MQERGDDSAVIDAASLGTDCRRASFAAGSVVPALEPPGGVLVVERGRGRLVAALDGRRLVVDEVGAGATLGCEGAASLFALDVVEPLEAVLLSPRDLEALARRAPLAAARFERRRAEDAVRRLARLTELVAEALAAERSLLSLLAHDLRSPLLAAEGGIAELLSRPEKYGPITPSQDRVLRRSRRSLGFLRQLVEEVVDVGRAAASAPRRDRTSLAEVLTEAIPQVLAAIGAARLDGLPEPIEFDPLRAALERQGVVLELEPEVRDLELVIDRSRLVRVIANLAGNALKYAQGLAVRARREDGEVEIAVSDRGPGIPEAFRALVFDRERQAEMRAAAVPRGFGLGLAGARELVLALGGTIRAETGEGGVGTRIVVRLPASPRT